MTKIRRKLRKMWKDKTGVSPIIAVILMVAITVVLAATIYAWVSGFGGGGGGVPAMSCSVNNADDELMVSDADPGIGWDDISIKVSQDCNLTFNGADSTNFTADTFENAPWTGDVMAGDVLGIKNYDNTTGLVGAVKIILRYDPENAIMGTWTVYV